VRCKIDENLPVEAAALLSDGGFSCDSVFDESLNGASDAKVSAACRAEGRVLVTLDLDFADIRAYPPAEYPGIVVLRPSEPSRDQVLALLARTIAAFGQEDVEHSLWIVEPGRIRVRAADDPQ
jgi:predicted nuclease of predicted toxin-antitoxin system